MNRIFESWWWIAIAIGLFVFYGGCFPSEPSREPLLDFVTKIALVLSLVMCVLAVGSWFIRFQRIKTFAFLRQFYWRFKYRRGCKVTFCCGYDGFSEILVVENRLTTSGTLVYRERGINGLGGEQTDFGPIREDTIPELVRRLTTFPEE